MAGELENGMRRTVVVHSRYAWRCHRTKAAVEGEQGLLIVTIEQLVARLAGGFLQFIDPDDLKTAVVAAVAEPLGEFEKIKTLPGFQRAAATSLSKAWSAGLKLTEEAETAADETAKARFSSLAMLEREVLSRLPDNQVRPRDVNGGAKLVHPGGAKLVHLTLCGTRCWGVVPVVHRRDPRCFV